MNIILFGFKGCGKTHFGKFLSSTLKRPFIDTDDLIVEWYKQQYGKTCSIRAIHHALQEKAFRDVEKRVIHQLKANADCVISIGGGSVLDLSNVTHLQKIGRLVHLKIDFDKVHKRILDHGVPSFVDPKDPFSSLYRIYQERMPIYEAISAECVDVGLLEESVVIDCLSEIFNQEAFSYGF